jgi:transposase
LNTVRGLLREFGVVIPVGARQVVPHVRALLEDADAGIPGLLRPALAEAVAEIGELETRLRAVERHLETAAAGSLVVGQLRTVPGIGVLTATALVAAVGDVQRFPSARHFASYLGLTPREHSSGARRRLGAISKRGDTYLRMLLIHGARAVLWHAKRPSAAARSAAHVGAAARTPAGSQQGRRRVSQQAGAHRLGGLDARHELHSPSDGLRRHPAKKGACETRH